MRIATTHMNTDFDALASMIAATLVYPDAIPIIPRHINPNVKAFLSIHKNLFDLKTIKEIDLDRVKGLIVVDVNRWERLDGLGALRERDGLEILLWDHHSNDGNILPTWECQEKKGATVTLLIRQLQEQQKILTPIQATLLLAGIYEDTGNLTFSSATAEDAYAAGYLLERKADLSVLNTFLRPVYGEKQKNILFDMLQLAKRNSIRGYKVCISKLPIEGHVDSLAVVVRMFREILNLDAAFGIFQDVQRSRCMVIGRSNVEGLNIGEIMKRIGGGGHPGAGSAMIKSVDPDKVESAIQEIIKDNQHASAQISDIMSFPVISVSSGTSMGDAAKLLRDKGCTGVPIVDGGKLEGMISRSDFKKLKDEKQLLRPVKAFMKRQVVTISPGKSPMQAARRMVKHDIGRLPVVENGEIIGILTRSDAMVYFYDLLPD